MRRVGLPGLASVLALALGLMPRTAHAQGATTSYESSQEFAFELKGGPYRPHVDDEFNGGKTPYKDLFGTGQHFLLQAELDYQLWHGFGSLAVGGQIGYTTQSAPAFIIDASGNVTTMRSTVDTTALTIVPIALLGVYRFDVPWKRYSIPLEPYAKLGLTYDFWWTTAGDGSIATAGGGRGRGGSYGFEGALGVGLLLDWADPEAAAEMDRDLGINHTYVSLEVTYAGVNDFGGGHGLNVGDATWNLGLAFEF